jgi:hypothetical protein
MVKSQMMIDRNEIYIIFLHSFYSLEHFHMWTIRITYVQRLDTTLKICVTRLR